jgi:lipopolysaccharide transport system permease protein
VNSEISTNNITRYSADSEVRDPVKLLSDIAKDAWSGRDLAWRLFLRNLRGMYRQTLLGLFWAFLPPIANTAVWIFLRQQGVFDTGEMTVNATLYILTGMILWQSFADALQMPLKIFNQNKSMISKLRFAREGLVLMGIGEVFFDLAIRMLLLIPAFLWFGVPLSWALLLAPLTILLMVLWAAGIGLLLMPIGCLYQDVGRFLRLAIPFWMIITPIIYVAPETFPGSLLVWLNPASPLLLFSRDLILVGGSSFWLPAVLVGVAAVPMFLLGMIVFRISIPVLVERMST